MTIYDGYFIVALGAFLVGLAKGGLPGVGNLTVILFASVFDPKASVGILLPVLISADIVSVIVYRQHADWKFVWRLLPWLLVGIVLGTVTFNHLSDAVVRQLIGWIVLSMTGLQILRTLLRKWKGNDFGEAIPHSWWYRSGLGIVGGFATMVANAAGPVAQLYFLSVGLPKLAFIGTGAWCFFLVNVIKVPLQMNLGIIHFESMSTSLGLMPFAVLGALIAPRIVKFIPQKPFTWLVWFFIVVAGIKLLS